MPAKNNTTLKAPTIKDISKLYDILSDDVQADFKNGVLKVTLKKDTSKEEVKQITIN